MEGLSKQVESARAALEAANKQLQALADQERDVSKQQDDAEQELKKADIEKVVLENQCKDGTVKLTSDLVGLKEKRTEVLRASGQGSVVSDCEVTAFREAGLCSRTCGGGTRRLERNVLHQAGPRGIPCPKLVLEVACNSHACPIDCQMGG